MWYEAPAIGIDLGTTYSCAAVYKDGIVTIVKNGDGKITIPSCVAFTRTIRLIGDEAKTRVLLSPENTIFDSKRMLGRKFDDPKIQQDIENWQFRVKNDCGKAKLRVRDRGRTQIFYPEEISAMVLREVKENAERHLGGIVMDAVISVPACFNDAQRQATKNAAKVAGLNVIRLITEPTAAALAYRVQQQDLKGAKNVLIFDLGGGKLDVSVIYIEKYSLIIRVRSTAGDSHLGGEDFDSLLVAHFVEEFKTKHQKDLRTCPKALRRLRIECEYAKRTLSSCSEVRIYLNCLFEGISFHSKLTRAQFEDMCMDLFQSTLKPVRRALFDAEVVKGSIDEVVLVGGSTRIPKIRELLRDFFDGKEPLSFIPDEAVAYGAAVQAAVLTGRAEGVMRSIFLCDVAPYSLLLETDGGVMKTVIHRNRLIPCEVLKIFSNSIEDSHDIKIYEGEHATAEENRLLGRFCFRCVPLGVPRLEVRFQLDFNGILDVNGEVRGGTQPLTVVHDRVGLERDVVDEMLDYAMRRQREEIAIRKRNEAKREYISYVYSVQLMVEYSSDDSLDVGERDMAIRICRGFLNWMDENPLAEWNVILDHLEIAHVALSNYPKKLGREHDIYMFVHYCRRLQPDF